MIKPNTFGIQVTTRCPNECSHCCFFCGPSKKICLSKSQILKTIRSLDIESIETLALTGGEPFLLGNDLFEIIKEASTKSLKVRVVTSGYFGKDKLQTKELLLKAKEAGLNEIVISWDDFHSEFVPANSVYNVFWQSTALGIQAGINIVRTEDSYWTRDRVEEMLGKPQEGKAKVTESDLNLTGRARIKLSGILRTRSTQLGPCRHVLSELELSAANKLLACCGLLPENKHLILCEDFKPENLNSNIEKGLKSPILNWLFLRGPFSIISWICAKYNLPEINQTSIGGNCEACDILFSRKDIAERIEESIIHNRDEIEKEITLLETLGCF